MSTKYAVMQIEPEDLQCWYVKLPTQLHTSTIYLENGFFDFRVILKFRSFNSTRVSAEIVTGDGVTRKVLMKTTFKDYSQGAMIDHIVGWFNTFYGAR